MTGWSGSAALVAGDTVYFNSAETWEESAGPAVLQVTGGVVYDGATWGTGTRAIFRAKADLNRSVIAMLKDHPSIPTVVRGFEVDAGGTITTGIGMNHPQMENTLLGATKRIEDCIVHDVMSFSAQNTYKYGIVISNWGAQYHVKNVEILDCKVYNISRGCINLYPGNDTGANRVENVLVRGNECWSAGMDPDYGGSLLAAKNHVINAVIEYNYIHDPVRGIGMGISNHPEPGFPGPENLVFRHNIIANSKHAGIYIQDGGDKSLSIYGNIIINSTYQGIILTDDLTGNLSIKMYNNTLVYNYPDNQWGEQVRILCKDATITALEFTNNLVYTTGPARALLDDHEVLTAHTNNLYHKTSGGTLIMAGGTNYTSADVAAWEPTAVTGNPLLFNTSNLPTGFTGTYGIDMKPNSDGLNITDSSPAKDNGSALGDTFNSSINTETRPFGDSWDIGAYEYNGVIGIRPDNKPVLTHGSDFHIAKKGNGILFTYNSHIQGAHTISIYDLYGNTIVQLPIQPLSETSFWDGNTATGTKCAPGCYLVYVKSRAQKISKRFMLYR
jgi:hypothetical protein